MVKSSNPKTDQIHQLHLLLLEERGVGRGERGGKEGRERGEREQGGGERGEGRGNRRTDESHKCSWLKAYMPQGARLPHLPLGYCKFIYSLRSFPLLPFSFPAFISYPYLFHYPHSHNILFLLNHPQPRSTISMELLRDVKTASPAEASSLMTVGKDHRKSIAERKSSLLEAAKIYLQSSEKCGDSAMKISLVYLAVSAVKELEDLRKICMVSSVKKGSNKYDGLDGRKSDEAIETSSGMGENLYRGRLIFGSQSVSFNGSKSAEKDNVATLTPPPSSSIVSDILLLERKLEEIGIVERLSSQSVTYDKRSYINSTLGDSFCYMSSSGKGYFDALCQSFSPSGGSSTAYPPKRQPEVPPRLAAKMSKPLPPDSTETTRISSPSSRRVTSLTDEKDSHGRVQANSSHACTRNSGIYHGSEKAGPCLHGNVSAPDPNLDSDLSHLLSDSMYGSVMDAKSSSSPMAAMGDSITIPDNIHR